MTKNNLQSTNMYMHEQLLPSTCCWNFNRKSRDSCSSFFDEWITMGVLQRLFRRPSGQADWYNTYITQTYFRASCSQDSSFERLIALNRCFLPEPWAAGSWFPWSYGRDRGRKKDVFEKGVCYIGLPGPVSYVAIAKGCTCTCTPTLRCIRPLEVDESLESDKIGEGQRNVRFCFCGRSCCCASDVRTRRKSLVLNIWKNLCRVHYYQKKQWDAQLLCSILKVSIVIGMCDVGVTYWLFVW